MLLSKTNYSVLHYSIYAVFRDLVFCLCVVDPGAKCYVILTAA